MSMSFVKRLRIVSFAALLGSLGGCALTNPYIDFETDYQRSVLPGSSVVNLDAGVAYARQTRAAYRAALGDRAELRSLLGIGLIGLSTAAMAIGIDGGSSTAILALGASGAATFGIASWLDSKPTERAYIAGYNAIGCAMDAVEPFRIAQTGSGWTDFTAGLDGGTVQLSDGAGGKKSTYRNSIDDNIEAVEVKIGELRGLLSARRAFLSAQRIAAAEADITAATTSVNNAVTVRRNGVALRRETELTGTRLVGAVDRITGEVDMAVLRNQPDLQALSSIVSGLGAAYAQFTAVPQSSKSASDIGGSGGVDGVEQRGQKGKDDAVSLPALESVRVQLRMAVAALSTSSRRIADFVNAVAADKPTAALRRCGVDVESIAGDISVEPQGPVEFVAGARSAEGRVILGGRQPYRAALVGTVNGLDVVQPELFGPAFVVQAADSLAAGRYSVLVADGAGHRQIIPVVVSAAASGGDGPQPGIDTLGALSAAEVKSLQTALCMDGADVDGKMGPNTRGAFANKKATTGASEAALLTNLLGLSDEQVAAGCKKQVSKAELEAFAGAFEGGDVLFSVGPAADPVNFRILKAELAANDANVVFTLQRLDGTPPATGIALDRVRAAIRSSAADAGKPVGDEHITFADETGLRAQLGL